jgi:hypothetical protein
LDLDDTTYEVEAGDVVHFDGGQEISPTATTDSTALLVLARKTEAINAPE